MKFNIGMHSVLRIFTHQMPNHFLLRHKKEKALVVVAFSE